MLDPTRMGRGAAAIALLGALAASMPLALACPGPGAAAFATPAECPQSRAGLDCSIADREWTPATAACRTAAPPREANEPAARDRTSRACETAPPCAADEPVAARDEATRSCAADGPADAEPAGPLACAPAADAPAWCLGDPSDAMRPEAPDLDGPDGALTTRLAALDAEPRAGLDPLTADRAARPPPRARPPARAPPHA